MASAQGAVERAMTEIEESGACYINGQYHAGSDTFDRAAQLATDADRRRAAWNARRAGFTVAASTPAPDAPREATGLDLDAETALELQRVAIALDDVGAEPGDSGEPPFGDTEWEREYWKTRAFPVHCSWCEKEGADPLMVKGNAALPITHGICPRHEQQLLGAKPEAQVAS